MTPTELKGIVSELGMPAFTAKQIAQWLYEKHAKSIDEMTNLSKQNRLRLAENYEVGALEPIDCQRSKDGTIKYLFTVTMSLQMSLTASSRRSIFLTVTGRPSVSPAKWDVR